MLRLAHKVGGEEFGIYAFVGNYEDFARPCNHINIHGAVEKLFGGSHENVAGADYFIDLGNRLRTVGKSRNSLSAAH